MATTYVAASECVVAKMGQDGPYVHVYKAQPLPEGVNEDQLKVLLDSGEVVKAGTKAADEAAAPDLTEPATGEPAHSAKKAATRP